MPEIFVEKYGKKNQILITAGQKETAKIVESDLEIGKLEESTKKKRLKKFQKREKKFQKRLKKFQKRVKKFQKREKKCQKRETGDRDRSMLT